MPRNDRSEPLVTCGDAAKVLRRQQKRSMRLRSRLNPKCQQTLEAYFPLQPEADIVTPGSRLFAYLDPADVSSQLVVMAVEELGIADAHSIFRMLAGTHEDIFRHLPGHDISCNRQEVSLSTTFAAKRSASNRSPTDEKIERRSPLMSVFALELTLEIQDRAFGQHVSGRHRAGYLCMIATPK